MYIKNFRTPARPLKNAPAFETECLGILRQTPAHFKQLALPHGNKIGQR